MSLIIPNGYNIQITNSNEDVTGYVYAEQGPLGAQFQIQRWVLWPNYEAPPAYTITLTPESTGTDLEDWIDRAKGDSTLTDDLGWRTGSKYVKVNCVYASGLPTLEPPVPVLFEPAILGLRGAGAVRPRGSRRGRRIASPIEAFRSVIAAAPQGLMMDGTFGGVPVALNVKAGKGARSAPGARINASGGQGSGRQADPGTGKLKQGEDVLGWMFALEETETQSYEYWVLSEDWNESLVSTVGYDPEHVPATLCRFINCVRGQDTASDIEWIENTENWTTAAAACTTYASIEDGGD